MFRAFRVVRTRPASTTALVGATAAVSLSDSSSKSPEKLPIYPTPTPDLILLDTPSPLELQIGSVRRRITHSLLEARNKVQSVVDKWIGVEHAVESRVKSIISPNEQLTPGLLYVGISTLTGSIIARSRSRPTRVFLPSFIFIYSLHHFLPETTENLKNYLGEVEERYLPHVAEKHAIANAHTRMLVDRIKEGTKEGRERFGKGVTWGVYKVQEVTGLKVGELLGKVEKEVESVKKEVQNVEKKVEKKVEEVEKTVEQHAKQIVEEIKEEAVTAVEKVVEKSVKQVEAELDRKVD